MSDTSSGLSIGFSESWLVETLGLPSEVLVSQRIPKKTLMEMGVGGKGGKKLVQDLVGELRWVSSLQSSNTGLPGATANEDAPNEIEVIWCRLRNEPQRRSMLTDLTSLIHRSIPYPLFLAIVGEAGWVELSLEVPAVIDGGLAEELRVDRPLVARLPDGFTDQAEKAHVMKAFQMALLPRISIEDLYIGWFDRLLSLHIFQRTKALALSRTVSETRMRYAALAKCTVLEDEITVLQSKAVKAKQMRLRSDLNLELRQKHEDLMDCQSQLVGSASARWE